MHTRDYRDIIGGLALALIGAFVAFHALTSLRLGTVSQMGPGMFPAALGFILAALGLGIAVPAAFRRGEMPTGDLRSFVAVLLSIAAFGFMIRPFGLVPAIVVLTVIASRADSRLSLIGTLILAASLSLVATLIFKVGLSMNIAIFSWPW